MDDFNPTEGQARALELIKSLPKRYPNGGGLAIISGYAGTGKTTLLKVLAKDDPLMFVLTPTGKAAVRVKEAAGCDSMTLHRWMYIPRKNEETGELTYDLRKPEELRIPTYGTLIIDEASMIGAKVFEHLRLFVAALGLNLVLIGDGFQLAPVEMDPELAGFSVFKVPDAERVDLTVVLRQALDSPIIRVSTMVREDGDISNALLELDFVPVAKMDDAAKETWDQRGVIICHRNVTRHSINAKIREMRGLSPDVLETDEPLLVMKNNYDLNVFNGEVFTVDKLLDKHGPVVVTDRPKNKSMYMNYQEATFFDNPQTAVISPEEVFGKSQDIDPDFIGRDGRRLLRQVYQYRGMEPPAFMNSNLGYALTCHKSQGSEWPYALVILEPSVRLGQQEGRRWLYTALTRAKNSVRVCTL